MEQEYETQGRPDDPCPPHSDCWCEIHPEACDHANPPTTSLHSNIGIVLLVGLALLYIYKKLKL